MLNPSLSGGRYLMATWLCAGAIGCGGAQVPDEQSRAATSPPGESWVHAQDYVMGAGLESEGEEAPIWQLTDETEFLARLTIANRSFLAVETVWMYPSGAALDGVGYAWREGETIDPGRSLIGRAVEGGWDIEVRAADGTRARVLGVELTQESLTRIAVDDDWWGRVDIVGSEEIGR